MSPSAKDIRCSECGRLLAKLNDGALTVHRGDVQATFDGEFHASFVCHRPGCGRLNVVRVLAPDTPKPPGSPSW